ncbi:MAG: hypothetical protein RL141_562 [Candidatus Parcubacteria bacterium]
MRFLWGLAVAIALVLPCATRAATAPTKPEHARASTVVSWSAAFDGTETLMAFEKEFVRGGNLATGDVNGDGAADIIVGAGPGRLPEVRMFKQDGSSIGSFRAYPAWFMGGVRVAVADLDGDGKGEIVTAPGAGIEPQVNVFRADGSQYVKGGVWAYAKGVTSGVHLAVGDTDGDGKPNIVTSPGPGAGPHVRVWNHELKPVRDFFAYDANMTDGVTVAVIRTPTGSKMVTGVESWASPLVRRFSADGQLEKEFYAYDAASRSGVSVFAWDMDADGMDEVVTAPNGGTGADVRVYDLYGTEYRRALVMDADYRGGVSVAALGNRLLTMPVFPVVAGPTDTEKSILVNLLQQRLYAFEHGRIARTFLVSTGTSRFPTPVMSVAVREKVPVKTYRWSYGPGNPNNYDLPGVKWNLRINGPYYIHYAYWHNNFGNRMSHGCINVGLADSEWIYNWAQVGVKVDVVS